MAAKQIDILLAGLMDLNGDPINGGKVETYEAGTSTPKNTWTDYDKSIVAANPIILDSAGRSLRFGEGLYKFIVKDASDAVLYTWDNINIELLANSYYGGNVGGSSTNLTLNDIKDFALRTGIIVSFNVTGSIDANATLNINGTGGFPIKNKISNTNLIAGELSGFTVVQFLGDHYKVLSSRALYNLGADYIGEGSLTFTPSSQAIQAVLTDTTLFVTLNTEGTTANTGAHLGVGLTGITALASFVLGIIPYTVTAVARNATSGAILPTRALLTELESTRMIQVFTPTGADWSAGAGRIIQLNLSIPRI